MSGWIILRTSPGRTLRLARSLALAGFEVWSPVEVQRKRRARSRQQFEVSVAVMPTYVFARANRLMDLIVLAGSEQRSFVVWDQDLGRYATETHPDFSIFRYRERYPTVGDRELDALRVAERRGTPLERVHHFAPGDVVRCPAAGFQGLSGIVETRKGKFALVAFQGFHMPVRIETLHLLPGAGTNSEQARLGTAA